MVHLHFEFNAIKQIQVQFLSLLIGGARLPNCYQHLTKVHQTNENKQPQSPLEPQGVRGMLVMLSRPISNMQQQASNNNAKLTSYAMKERPHGARDASSTPAVRWG